MLLIKHELTFTFSHADNLAGFDFDTLEVASVDGSTVAQVNNSDTKELTLKVTNSAGAAVDLTAVKSNKFEFNATLKGSDVKNTKVKITVEFGHKSCIRFRCMGCDSCSS